MKLTLNYDKVPTI